MYTVGLTGGIGSGKSTVAQFFKELGASVLDADVMVKNLLEKEAGIQRDLVAHFGKILTDSAGNINRRVLRQIIFEDSAARQWLEALLHPRVLAQIERELQAMTCSYCLLVAPLLVRSVEARKQVQRLLVIDVPTPIQIRRVMERDDLSEQAVSRIIAVQPSREELLHQADDIICNTSDLETLQARVIQLHHHYMAL